MIIKKVTQSLDPKGLILDTLDSNSTTDALSANQGKILNDKIKDIKATPTGDTLPIGTIIEFGSDTIPDNWLLCNGQTVSRTTYKELFSVIGTTYGSGDGSTTFNLPDYRDRVPVGKDSTDSDFNTLGNTGRRKNTYTYNR